MIWSQNPRAYMSPLDPGPWLDDVRTHLWWDRRPDRERPLPRRDGAVVVPGTHRQDIRADGGLPFAGVCGLLLGLIQLPRSLLRRRWTQTCPACLHRMDRGVTTCPHCQFQPPQGGGVKPCAFILSLLMCHATMVQGATAGAGRPEPSRPGLTRSG